MLGSFRHAPEWKVDAAVQVKAEEKWRRKGLFGCGECNWAHWVDIGVQDVKSVAGAKEDLEK